MRHAIILHGKPDITEQFDASLPSPSNNHWIPWLQKQLLMKGIQAQTPEVPEAHKPMYGLWQRELERYEIDENTILVGHSCGAGFLVRWLSENDVKVDKVLLVAPWLDPEKTAGDFCEFEIDPNLDRKAKELHILYSLDDPAKTIKPSVELLKKKLKNYKYHEFKNKGHFCLEEMKTDAFPELLELIIS